MTPRHDCEFIERLKAKVADALARPADEVFNGLIEKGFIDESGNVTVMLRPPPGSAE